MKSMFPVSYTHLDSIVYKRGFDTRDLHYQGVRQGCSISPTVFNIYIDAIVRECKLRMDPGIKINNRTYVNTMNGLSG